MTPQDELLVNYWKEHSGHYKEIADYFRRSPVTWLTKKEMSDILVANKHWKLKDERFHEICKAIHATVVKINSRKIID